MNDFAQPFDFARDEHADAAQLRQVRGIDRQSGRLGVDDGVERDLRTRHPRESCGRQWATGSEASKTNDGNVAK
jgi:hypothetical protein